MASLLRIKRLKFYPVHLLITNVKESLLGFKVVGTPSEIIIYY